MPEPPTLKSHTLEARAARSGEIWEARMAARNQVVDEFETVDDPREIPIRQKDRGFGPADSFLDWAEPLEAAHQLDPEFPRQDLGPADVREVEGGYQPAEPVRRRSAAYEFEETTPLDEVNPQQDLVPTAEGFGLAGPAQRQLGAAELDPQYPEVDIGAGDVERRGEDAFGLTPSAERTVAAERLEDQTTYDDLAPSDVQRADDGGWELLPGLR